MFGSTYKKTVSAPTPPPPPANQFRWGQTNPSTTASGFGSGNGGMVAPKHTNEQEFQDLKATFLSNFDFRGIQVSATPLLPSVLRGVNTEMPVLFQIKVGQRSKCYETEFARTPFNATLVLDISGSMSGSRLSNCKSAINTIIESLTPHDTISLVVYGSVCRTVFVDCTEKHKVMMLKAVQEINCEGCTNLHGGLELGIQTLRQSMAKESEKVLQRNAHRVFLFSDGLVNEGITDRETILKHCQNWIKNDISISTFGIGHDYDEKIMKAIAESSNGDSFFIETEADIEEIVAKGLRGISRMIAPGATLKVRGLGDAVVKDIPGYEQSVPGQISLKSLRTNGLIQFVVNLDIRVPGLKDFSENEMEDVLEEHKILGYQLSLEGENFVDKEDYDGFVGTVSVNYTINTSLVAEDKKHDDVVSYLTIKECAKMDKEVVEHLANNRTEEAIKVKQAVIGQYKAVANRDRWGFSKVMAEQSERLVANVQGFGSTSYAKKLSAQQQQEASDDDMGFGLFD